MGIFNFKRQFREFVIEGSKRHTIRAPRKHPEVAGRTTMHNYCGLRQKGAELLLRAPCVKVETIVIWHGGEIFVGPDIALPKNADKRAHWIISITASPKKYGLVQLDLAERDLLAWKDGFRPAGATEQKPTGAHTFMMGFWDGRLPFLGYLNHWDYARAVRK